MKVYRWVQKFAPEIRERAYAKCIGEWNARSVPEDVIRPMTRKHLNNRIEGDRAAIKHRLTPMRGLQSLSTAKATIKGIETFRAIRKGHFAECECAVANKITFVRKLFNEVKQAAESEQMQAVLCFTRPPQRIPERLSEKRTQTKDVLG